MSHPQDSHPIAWSDEQYQSFEKIAQVNKHSDHLLPLFQTDALIALLDEYPRKHLHLKNPGGTHSALLISSPKVQVHFHLDAEPNMFWHLRVEKDVWLYPAMDPELVPQEYLEDIYAGEIGRNLPYQPDVDKRAVHARLQPLHRRSEPRLASFARQAAQPEDAAG